MTEDGRANTVALTVIPITKKKSVRKIVYVAVFKSIMIIMIIIIIIIILGFVQSKTLIN